MPIKIWIELAQDDFFIHFSEPTHADHFGWYSNGSELGLYALTETERNKFHQIIKAGQVAEFEFKKCWESNDD